MFNAQSACQDVATPQHNFASTAEINVLGNGFQKVRLKSPDVEDSIQKLVHRLDVNRIVDLGCEDGAFLKGVSLNKELKCIGLDLPIYHQSFCHDSPQLKFVPCHFDSARSIEEATDFAEDDVSTLFLAVGLLGYLMDPRPLLRRLRQLLKKHPNNRLVLTVPHHTKGMSVQEPVLRAWHKGEFETLICSSGFVIVDNLNTESDLVLTVSCSEQSHQSYLAIRNLPPLSRHILVATETILHERYGGIASYLYNLWKILPHKPIIYSTYLLPGDLTSNSDFRSWVLDRKKLMPSKGASVDSYPDERSMSVLEELQHFLFLYDTVEVVEIQDFIGDAYRLCQAKRAGVISPRISVLCRGHGNHNYLERAGRKWFDISYERMMLNERIAIELADCFVPATNYLRNLYTEVGIKIPERTSVLPLPYFPSSKKIQTGAPEVLVFFGKPIEAKGFSDFVDVVKILSREQYFCEHITKILILGGLIPEEFKNVFESLPATISVDAQFVTRDSAQVILQSLGGRALVIMPYRDDNRPISMLEAIDAGCHPIAYARGGVPEIIPSQYHSIILCDEGVESLAGHIRMALTANNVERLKMLGNLRNDWSQAQQKINDDIETFYEKVCNEGEKFSSKSRAGNKVPDISVVIPVYNTPLRFIEELIEGLNIQIHSPKEIIFVNDGSKSDYEELLNLCIEKRLHHSFRIVSHTENRGLAAVRNIGLAECTTQLLVSLNPNNIPLATFISDLVAFFAYYPDTHIALGLERQFADGDDWRSSRAGLVHAPIGLAGLITQTQNTLGHGDFAVSVNKVVALGGWPEGHSMWEDWDLHLRTLYSGGQLAIVPRVTALRRNSPQYGAQHRDQFLSEVRISNATVDMDLWGHNRLQPLLRTLKQDYEKAVTLILSDQSSKYLERTHKTIRSTRSNQLPPAVDMGFVNNIDVVWRLGSAKRLNISSFKSGKQEVSIGLYVELLDAPTAWVELLQLGDSPEKFCFKVFIGPEGKLRIVFASGPLKQHTLDVDVDALEAVNDKAHIGISISADIGCLLLWANGKRILTHVIDAWELQASTALWVGSRHLKASITGMRVYLDFLVDLDIPELM